MLAAGTSVRLKADPGRTGVITGKTTQRAGRLRWQVKFPEGANYHLESQLEIVPDESEDALELISQGKLGRARDLRGNITHIRLNGRLANLIYSMETTNTDFYAYQYKPVLQFLDSPSNGILIADEVGLGKTIEAGLIWTELRSRYDTRRLLVLCPAMLLEKWEMELKRKFGISADIVKTQKIRKLFDNYRNGDQQGFAAICSMQGLRPRKGWEKSDQTSDINSAFARYLDDIEYDEPILDLLIVDEAHYMRNPESMTAKLGHLLRRVSDHVVLLSATPIHLKNEDLFQQLTIVDEDTFNRKEAFEDILTANEPLIQAREAVLHSTVLREDLIGYLEAARSHHLLSENRQIASLLKNIPAQDQLKDYNFRTYLANKLENVNLLGKAVIRTRKREVEAWRVERKAVPETIPMAPQERRFYEKVTELVRKYSEYADSFEAFLLVMPQRQMSSSMAAALYAWQNKHSTYVAEQLYEDFGSNEELDSLGPLTRELVENAFELGDFEELRAHDSKYKRLIEKLRDYFTNCPDEKVVLFAYFRPTLHYLKKRLGEDGIKTFMLMGGNLYWRGRRISKHEMIEKFEKFPGACVLLSSEVASEGVDLQFAKVVINYDLPWNPMKVEQRIGRIDRLGQKSERIIIWNLFYQETIDERIYERLYKRLNIFEKALGGLEAVLGDVIRKLTLEILTGKFTKEEEEIRIEQTAQAMANIRAEEEKLEEEAINLVAHGEYILNRVKAARELQRCIGGDDLWLYVRDFFIKHYPGCEFKQLQPDELLFEIILSDQAKFDLEQFLRSNSLIVQTRLYRNKMRCQFINRVETPERKGLVENINQFHPLVRFVSTQITQADTSFYPAVGVQIHSSFLPEYDPGIYVFYVHFWSLSGIREIEQLCYVAKPAIEGSAFLASDDAEKLITTAAWHGDDWLSVSNLVDLAVIAGFIDHCIGDAEQKYETFVEERKQENNDRADVQEKTLLQHRDQRMRTLHDLMLRYELSHNQKLIKLTQGRISKLEERIIMRRLQINKCRELRHHSKEICAGLISVM
ncbi:SNF2-related protein [candidate division CSSED10-310 bacterium]|uniref:SNF2-related protein n=1 Tax=candidate division CSSED10-310 bacterium TaxID=2855610 RepID=A0ABV6YY15_UNCC1